MKLKEDFISLLGSSLQLEDITHLASIKQSSAHSKRQGKFPDISAGNEDDLFVHTNSEANPWIQLDFGREYYPEYIFIDDRRSAPCDHIAAKLIVEYSSESGGEYELIHKEKVFFGASSKGLPLTLHLAKKIKLKSIRIRLESEVSQSLHLSQVNVLIEQKPKLINAPTEKARFYSARDDGFGERLKGLLNAMVMSRTYGCSFGFMWENMPPNSELQHHAISEAEKTFSPGFLSAHRVSKLPEKIIKFKVKMAVPKLDEGTDICYQVNHDYVYRQLPALKNFIPEKAYAEAFRDIGFSPELEYAISQAYNVDLRSNKVAAIHLRAGDIVYGRYRHGDRYTNKAISYAMADYILGSLGKLGYRVVIFGQEASVCRKLAEKYQAIYLGDLPEYSVFSAEQLALFDVVLMSRCQLIFAGQSGFSQLAELISEAVMVRPQDYFDTHNMVKAISGYLESDEVKEFDDYQNAYSYWQMVYMFAEYLGTQKCIDYLCKAISYDPDNLFYKLVLASFYCEVGDVRSAGIIAENCLAEKKSGSNRFGGYRHLKRLKYPDGTRVFKNYNNKLRLLEELKVKGGAELVSDFL